MDTKNHDYIKLENCEHGFIYKIRSRNLKFGVFNKNDNGFIGIREKFDFKYLFTEYHWDTGAPYGTVKPKERLMPVPEDIQIMERFDSIDKETGRKVEFKEGSGWYFLDSGEVSQQIQAVSPSNDLLFNFLEKIEAE